MKYLFLGARFGNVRDKVFGIVSPYTNPYDIGLKSAFIIAGGKGKKIQFYKLKNTMWSNDLIEKKQSDFFQPIELDEFKKVYPTFEHELEQQLIMVGLRGV